MRHAWMTFCRSFASRPHTPVSAFYTLNIMRRLTRRPTLYPVQRMLSSPGATVKNVFNSQPKIYEE